jgi:hypothetical protein
MAGQAALNAAYQKKKVAMNFAAKVATPRSMVSGKSVRTVKQREKHLTRLQPLTPKKQGAN